MRGAGVAFLSTYPWCPTARPPANRFWLNLLEGVTCPAGTAGTEAAPPWPGVTLAARLAVAGLPGVLLAVQEEHFVQAGGVLSTPTRAGAAC